MNQKSLYKQFLISNEIRPYNHWSCITNKEIYKTVITNPEELKEVLEHHEKRLAITPKEILCMKDPYGC